MLAIAVLAFFVRLLFLLSSPDRQWPHSIWYEGDAPEWVTYAGALNAGSLYEFGLPLRSPAVAYLLHWLQPGTMQGPFTNFKLLWCGISAATCGLAYLGFAVSFGRRIALIASVMCVFSFGLYITATSLNNETLYTFVLMLIVLGSQRLRLEATVVLGAIVGSLHGVATLIRPEHTLLLVLLVPWMLRPRRDSSVTPASVPRRLAMTTVVLVASVVVCLPWTISGVRAAQQLNQNAKILPSFERVSPTWTADGQALIRSFPPYAQFDNFRWITAVAASRQMTSIDAAFARDVLMSDFGALPEPINSWTFVSSQGPMSFALANHPDAHGRFSKAAMINPKFGNDPRLNLTMPSHVRLYNHGYAMGLDSIRSDPKAWLNAVCEKLGIFSEGITLGFTAVNLPDGRNCIRRPVDIATPSDSFGKGDTLAMLVHAWWRIAMLGLIVAGLIIAAVRRVGAAWVVIILYKLLVTVAFYGYARQAVSILPAFFVLIALAIDPIMRWLAAKTRAPRPTLRVAACGGIGVLLLVDVIAAARGQQFSRPDLKQGEFRSFDEIVIKPAP